MLKNIINLPNQLIYTLLNVATITAMLVLSGETGKLFDKIIDDSMQYIQRPLLILFLIVLLVALSTVTTYYNNKTEEIRIASEEMYEKIAAKMSHQETKKKSNIDLDIY